MSCGKLPERRPVHDGEPVQLELLRAGRLLLDGLHGDVRVVRAGGIARRLLVGAGGAGSAQPVRRQGVATCGTDGSCNGSGALPAVRAGTMCVAATCARLDADPNATCNGAAPVSRRRRRVRAVRVRHRRVQDDLHDQRRLQRRPVRLHRDDVRHRDERDRPGRDARDGADQSGGHAGLQAVTTTGRRAIPLSEMTLRYWYTIDTTPVWRRRRSSTTAARWKCANVSLAPFAAVSPAQTNADFYSPGLFRRGRGKPRRRARTPATSRRASTRTTSATTTRRTTTRTTTSPTFMATTKVTAYRARRAGLRHRAAVVGRHGAGAATAARR